MDKTEKKQAKAEVKRAKKAHKAEVKAGVQEPASAPAPSPVLRFADGVRGIVSLIFSVSPGWRSFRACEG